MKILPVAHQFLKFATVGVLNTTIDFSIYTALTRLADWHFLYANAVSFLSAVTVSFWINRFWTFRDRPRRGRRQYVLFFVVNLIALGFNEALLASFVHIAHVHDLIAKALATCLVLFWNFFANRTWTFRASPNVGLPVAGPHDILDR